MALKKKLSKESSLCVIVDSLKTAQLAIRGGADIIQLRDKKAATIEFIRTAKAIKRLTARYKVPLIVNDRLDAAKACNADGIHVGRGDISVKTARKILGSGKIVGVSVKNRAQAKAAKRDGADYFGVGPVFRTPVKKAQAPKGLGLLNSLKNMKVPLFAIGGINITNVDRLARAGFKKIAVIRAVCGAKNPFMAARKLKKALY